ncbi:acyltransferase family protein [Aeromonas jandaei]|uniref:acyltransferase family protein n=1 Tax=Aeromonas jandaei TaxID=650 RepID=UPI001C0586AC|nr:acyltransferase [Aeromonas jandaei]
MHHFSPANIKLDQLTGLRYFAALLVFLSHIEWDESNMFSTILKQGYVGVSFFFVLSGFILSHSYGWRILNGSLCFREYILLRFARLSPLHFATAAPFVFFACYKNDFQPTKILLNLSFLQSWIPNSTYYFSLNAPSWSLSNEMFFYACFFPLVLLPLNKLLKLCCGLLALITFVAAIFSLTLTDHVFFGEISFAHWLFYIFPGFRLLEFIVGMCLYHAWRNNFRFNKVLAIPSYIILFLAMYFASDVSEEFRMSLYFIPFIALFFYAHLSDEGVFVRVLSSKIMMLLGNASFAFYLIHQPLILVLRRVLGRFEFSDISFAFISLTIISFVSVLIYLFYERKAELFLKSFFINKKRERIAAT